MWNQKKISIVLPVYNEEKGVKACIEDFFSTGVVDEVIAVDNNSIDNSARIIKESKAKYFNEKTQGYGAALQRGLKEAKGDYIVVAEPDGTFIAKDIFKFLAYVDEFDVIFGTRTSKSLIWSGAKMNWFLRVGNVIVAKLLEYLHNGPCLTDVGCTMKIIKKDSLEKIQGQFSVKGSHFNPEFMILTIKNEMKCVEIPVNYKERIGDSKITSDFWKSFKLGIIMIGLIYKKKYKK